VLEPANLTPHEVVRFRSVLARTGMTPEEESMRGWTRTMAVAFALLGLAAVSHAEKARCRIYIGDGDYKLIDTTYTRGGCELAAKQLIEPRWCSTHEGKYEFKYMFDGEVYHGSGYCSSRSHSSSSHGASRCKVRTGDDWHYLDRTYTKGGCAMEARKYIGPRRCDGQRHFHYTYQFDDDVYEDEGLCSTVN
jgi:hypothetical protein